MHHHLNDPTVVGAMRFVAALAEYYAETDTNADEIERDLLQIIEAHHEPFYLGEPEGSRDLARRFCGIYAASIREYQDGELPWYGSSEIG